MMLHIGYVFRRPQHDTGVGNFQSLLIDELRPASYQSADRRCSSPMDGFVQADPCFIIEHAQGNHCGSMAIFRLYVLWRTS
jgi:hypothetical protein